MECTFNYVQPPSILPTPPAGGSGAASPPAITPGPPTIQPDESAGKPCNPDSISEGSCLVR